ncbi:copper-binding protein [Marinobacter sp.]|uniref:copper-binding protein n=1 Tax=Marinobacter sp. TaxID=50741 RepID=UPI00384B914E
MKKSLIQSAILASALLLGAPAHAEMKHEKKDMDMGSSSQSAQMIESKGTVNKIMPGKNKVVITHEPIPELKWPTMKMTFSTADEVNLDALDKGDAVRFVIEAKQGKNTIVEIEPAQ